MATVKTYQEGDDKRKQAYNYFISKGYSPQVAAGIVGNLVHESGLNTSIEGDIGYKGGSSFGVAQWRGERLKKLKERYGEKWTNFDNQLEFVDWELKNTHKSAGEKLIVANTIHEAGQIFSDFYEIPKKKYHENENRRLAVERVGQDYLTNQEPQNINTEQTNFDNTESFPNFEYQQTPHTRIGAGLPNIEETEEKNTSKEKEDTSKEKEALLQKQREHKFIQDYLSGNIQQPQQEQQIQRPEVPQFDPLQEYAEISSFVENPIMQEGGKIPVSKNGVFDSNGKPVIVPSNKITMTGVNYPILGISQETGERKIMLPNVENYFFKDTQNVLEIPMMQQGGKTAEELKEIMDRTKKSREENETPLSVKQGMYMDENSKTYEILKNKNKSANQFSNALKNVTSYFSGTKDESLLESKYRPTINDDSDIKYYYREGMKQDVFRDFTSKEVMEVYNHNGTFEDVYKALKTNGKDRKHRADKAFPKNQAGYKGMYNNGHGSMSGEFNLGRYKVDAGEDEKGKYVSFYDVYDWNGFKPESSKPIHFYDRIYENEWKDLNKLKQGGKVL